MSLDADIIKEEDNYHWQPTLVNPRTGTTYDLTDAAEVRLYVDHLRSDTLVVNSAVEIVDAANGEVAYDFSRAETARAGTHRAEFVVEETDGDYVTVPNDGYVKLDFTAMLPRGADLEPATADTDATVATLTATDWIESPVARLDELATEEINNVTHVSTESELKTEIGNGPIALADDFTWSGAGHVEDVGSSDIYIDGRDKTVTRGDAQDDLLLNLTTTGDVVIKNLNIDGNNANNSDSGDTNELHIKNAESCIFENVSVKNNLGMAMRTTSVDHVRAPDCEVISNGGAHDGIHIIDPINAVVSGGVYETSDDSVVCRLLNRDAESFVVSGVSAEVPTGRSSGAGVRIFADTNARTIDSVRWDLDIGTTLGASILLNEIGGGDLTVKSLKCDANVSDPGSWAFLDNLSGGVQQAEISGSYVNGDVKFTGATDVTANLVVDNSGGRGLYVQNCQGVNADIIAKNCDNGVEIRDSDNVYLKGVIHDCSTGVSDVSSSSDHIHGEIHTYNNTTDLDLSATNSTLSTV